jgi:CBS domain-containing protein
MQASDIMNKNPVCALPHMSILEVAQMMVEHDCGSIPVVDNEETMKPLTGIVTDRDIVCRLVAKGKNPLACTVDDCMTTDAVSVKPGDSIETCARVMREHQIRRVPVLDADGVLVGLVTQAQLAKHLNQAQVGALLQEISKKTAEASRR